MTANDLCYILYHVLRFVSIIKRAILGNACEHST